jgi:hypothetical protein
MVPLGYAPAAGANCSSAGEADDLRRRIGVQRADGRDSGNLGRRKQHAGCHYEREALYSTPREGANTRRFLHGVPVLFSVTEERLCPNPHGARRVFAPLTMRVAVYFWLGVAVGFWVSTGVGPSCLGWGTLSSARGCLN